MSTAFCASRFLNRIFIRFPGFIKTGTLFNNLTPPGNGNPTGEILGLELKIYHNLSGYGSTKANARMFTGGEWEHDDNENVVGSTIMLSFSSAAFNNNSGTSLGQMNLAYSNNYTTLSLPKTNSDLVNLANKGIVLRNVDENYDDDPGCKYLRATTHPTTNTRPYVVATWRQNNNSLRAFTFR